MRQAILLAAGLGSRLGNLTKVVPKPLIPINGKPIIERNIEYIIEAGLDRVILVVGYMKEKFDYLKDKYAKEIEIIPVFNPQFKECNTISSMYYASQYFSMDSYVITADLYLRSNIYQMYSTDESFYLQIMVKNLKKPEWIAELSKDNYIISVNKTGYSGSMYTGMSFWKEDDLKKIKKKLLLSDMTQPEVKSLFWDELWFPEFAVSSIRVKHIENSYDFFEVDDCEDLQRLKDEEGDCESIQALILKYAGKS